MPFIPLATPRKATDPAFPRVSADEQAGRDADAERLVLAEFSQDMPEDSRAALETEYAQRFGKQAPTSTNSPAVRRGFIPLDAAGSEAPKRRGFIPLADDMDGPSAMQRTAMAAEPYVVPALKTMQALGSGYPVVETAANLLTTGVALPVAGIAGIGTSAANALGLTNTPAADVVHAIGGALTYQPMTDLGQHLTNSVMYPFAKLAQAGQWAGNETLDATDSPAMAAAVDTAINALPMAIAPALKGGKALREKVMKGKKVAPETTSAQDVPAVVSTESPRGFTPLQTAVDVPQDGVAGRGAAESTRTTPEAVRADERARNGAEMETGARRLASNAPASPEPETQGFSPLRREGSPDLPGVGDIREVSGRPGAGTDAGALARAAGRDGELRADELRMDNASATGATARLLSQGEAERPGIDHRGGVPGAADEGLQTATADLGIRPGIARGGEFGALGAEDRALADIQRRDVADSAVGEAHRAVDGSAAVSIESRMAGRVGAESGATPGPKTARYALIEADDLRASHDTNLRPVTENPFGRQDAARHENEAAVQSIVREIEPAKLAESMDDASGAPIVARDGVVEAGQRRAIALQRVYEANGMKADAYRQHLRENAARLGLDPAAVDSMRKPVLVRVPDEPAPRRAAADTAGDMPPEGKVNSFAPGAEYVGFINDAPRPGAAGSGTATPASAPSTTGARPKPIRREDVLIPFMKALDTGIYEGRVKGKSTMGFFRPKLEEVRIKRHADLETAAHELAHLIDYRVPEVRKSWHSGPNWKIHAEELRGLSYDASKIYEGFAEFVRHYMTQPDVAAAKAPVFSKWFDDFVSRHEYGPAIEQARKGMTEWFAQDAIDRARSKIGDHRPLSDALDGQWDSFRQATVDDLHGVMRMERELTGKLAPVGAYESARLTRASQSIADGALRFGAPVKNADGSFSWKGKGLEEILKPLSEKLDDALLYFVGRSSRELLAQQREHLFTPGEIDAMLRLKTPERAKAFAEYQEWNKAILDFAEAQGVINPETRALWKRTEYLPFHRVASPDGMKGKPGDWSGVKALTGGTENIRDVLANMTANAAMLIDKAVKNEARIKIANLAEKTQGGGKFMVKIPAEQRPVKVTGDQVLDAMFKRYGIAVDGAAPGFFEFLIHGQPPAGPNIVAVLKGGKPVWYEVNDPILYRALSAIDRPHTPWIVRMLGIPKRIGQMTITLTPDFMIANIARDTIMGSVMSRAGFRPVIDSLQGMRLRLTNDPLYKEFVANGGGMSSMFLDETRFRAKLERFYQKQGVDYRTVLDAPAKLLNFVETLADSFEMSTRLGEYARAIKNGENPRHAAYLGRDVSTDFAMRGDSKALGFMYDTVMFLRPALISWDRLYRGLAHDPNKGAIAVKAATLAGMSAVLYLLNKDDPRYQDLPDWDRDTHWHFFIGDQHFRYPKIWEIGALASGAERTVEKIIEADPAGLGKDFARILGATFNVNLMPQILAPLYEQATNRNPFTKAPIETPGMENVQPFLRAKPTTSETMKAAGMATRDLPESLQVNPVRAEALLRGYFNTWGLYAIAASDHAFFGDKLPESRTDQLPVVRRFYSQEPPQHTKYESMFYDMLGEAKRLHGSLRELDKIGRKEIADEKEREPLATEAKPLERASKNLQAINQEMRLVRRSDTTPEEKRARLDQLTVERNALLKAAVQDSEAAQKAPK